MYKKTAETSHYLPRVGQYSTHPKRNGCVDVLPPQAQMPLYSAESQVKQAEQRIRQLGQQRQALIDQIHFLKGVGRLQSKFANDHRQANKIKELHRHCEQIESEIRKTTTTANEIKTLLKGDSRASYSEIFERLAKVELPHDVYEKIKDRAQRIKKL